MSPPNADHFSQQTFDSLQTEVSLRKQLQADMLTRDHLYKKEQINLLKASKLLREQEDFVLSIKLDLATMNKSYQESQSQAKREKAKIMHEAQVEKESFCKEI